MVEWNNKRIILSVPACCDTDSIAGVCGDLLQDTVGLDGPSLLAGDCILVDKCSGGARLFNVLDAVEKRR